MRKVHKIIVAVGLVSAAAASTIADAASIADTIKVNSVYRDAIHVGRAVVPLPDGEWTVTSVNESRNNAKNVLVEVNLAAIVDQQFQGYISIGTNEEISGTGWATYNFCDRTDIYAIVRDANQAAEQSCWGVNHFVWDKTSTYKPTFGVNIQEYLASRGLKMPGTTISTQFRFSNRSDYLNYFIYRNPMLAGFKDESGKWADSSWHKQLVKADSAKVEYLEQLKTQGAALYATMKGGAVFKGHGDGGSPTAGAAAPGTVAAGTVVPPAGAPSLSIEQRLSRLKDLLDRNLISTGEYDEKRKKILDEL